MIRPLTFPFYPVVIAALFPIQLYAGNLGFFDAYHAARLTLVVLLLWAAALLALRFALRSRDLAAFLLASATVAAFVVWPHALLVLVFLLAAAITGLAIRRLRLVRDATVLANVVSLSLLIAPLAKIAGPIGSIAHDDSSELSFGSIPGLAETARARGTAFPSVVHIVLDAYGGRTALQRLYGFDNSAFAAALAEAGFLVFDDVPVPYNQTLLSVSTVMNGDYPPLGALASRGVTDERLRLFLARSTLEGSVIEAFRGQGHEIHFTESGYNAFRYPRSAHLIAAPAGPFELSLIDIHFLLFYVDPLGVRLLGPAQQSAPLDRRVKAALSPGIAGQLKPPFFLYSHVLSPHPPFSIDRDGNPTGDRYFSRIEDGDEATRGSGALVDRYRAGYVEKLRFTNEAILAQVTRMIGDIDGPLVIVIHGDHGGGSRLAQEDAGATCLRERMQTTVAIYTNVPEIREAYRSTGLGNIVNIYPILFAALAGTEPVLRSGQFFARWSAPGEADSLEGADFDRNCD